MRLVFAALIVLSGSGAHATERQVGKERMGGGHGAQSMDRNDGLKDTPACKSKL
jgi:hypothetical protein